MKKLLTYAVMSYSRIIACVQYTIVLIELHKVLSQEIKCSLYSKTSTVLSEWTVLKSVDVSLLHLYCIRYKNMVRKYINTVYTVHIYSRGPLSACGIVTHYIGWGFQFPNPEEIHCFKWEFYVWFVRFRCATYLRNVTLA